MRAIAIPWVPEKDVFEQSLRLIVLLNLLDALYTTFWVVKGLAVEANPLMAGALMLSPQLFVLSKLALVSLSVYVLWTLREVPAARLASVPVALIYAFVGGQHLGFMGLLGWITFF